MAENPFQGLDPKAVQLAGELLSGFADAAEDQQRQNQAEQARAAKLGAMYARLNELFLEPTKNRIEIEKIKSELRSMGEQNIA